MPTLVWRRRPGSGADASKEGSAIRREVAVPDLVVSAAAAAVPDGVAISAAMPAVPGPVASPAASSKRYADGGKQKKKRRIIPRAEVATAAKKRAKAKPERDLPTGVYKQSPGRFVSTIQWGGKMHYIGVFNTPEQASAAYVLIRRERDNVELSAVGADEVNTAFAAAKTKALEAVGFVPKTRDLPRGVYTAASGKFMSMIKHRYIGSFDTPEQASAAYLSVRKALDDAKLSAFGADEVNATFDAAKTKSLKSFGGFLPKESEADDNDDDEDSDNGLIDVQGGVGTSAGRKMGRWSTEEDAELLRLVKTYHPSRIKWTKIAKGLGGGRLGTRCRERYYNQLDPTIKRGSYTAEEDEKICAEVADMGTKWVKIAALLPGRTENQIKTRWYSTLKKKVASGGFVAATSKSAAANQYSPEQSADTCMSDLDDAKQSAVGADNENVIDAAKKKVLEMV